MNEILRNFRDPSWWLTVVICGVIINLASAYLKPYLDRFPETLSTKLRRSVASYMAEIETVRGSTDRQILTQLLKIEYLLKIIGAAGLAVLLLGTASGIAASGFTSGSQVLSGAGILASIYASACIGRYRRLSDILHAAWQKPPTASPSSRSSAA